MVGGKEICLAAGMTDFLSKPMRRAALDAMLTKWVGKTHANQQDLDTDDSGRKEVSTYEALQELRIDDVARKAATS